MATKFADEVSRGTEQIKGSGSCVPYTFNGNGDVQSCLYSG